MKIVHIHLCGPYTEGAVYQENLLSKYHVKLGHSVVLLVSKWTWNDSNEVVLSNEEEYVNSDSVHIARLSQKGKSAKRSKFARFKGLYGTLCREKPDVIFVHGCQFLDMAMVQKYIRKERRAVLYIDNHADFSNSATNFLSRILLHKILWRFFAKRIEPYVRTFYGVLPARVDFLTKIYGISPKKVKFLPLGADDELAVKAADGQGEKIRRKYGIAKEDFLVVTGGKIDAAKAQTLLLMQAVKRIRTKKVSIKLLVFGSISDELKDEALSLCDGKKIVYAGWIDAKESYKYFAAADVVCFPGRHSVFWEQAAGQGIPLIVKEWAGTKHIDARGNALFLKEDSPDEMYDIFVQLAQDTGKLCKMKEAALKAKKRFSYLEIAKKSLGLVK